jgi:NAD(P)-dependent dehydrogenase (short-subunit alcohol dehydrogenase family)
MDLKGRTVLVLGGAGLVGLAVSRRMLSAGASRVVVASLREHEVEAALEELRQEFPDCVDCIQGHAGDIFLPDAIRNMSRHDILNDPRATATLVDELYGELNDEVLRRSSMGKLVLELEPDVVVDCINTAGALAYQNAFASVAALRESARSGSAPIEAVNTHLATLYLPQLIRHVQVALEAMKRVGTEMYVKVGTAGTGGMGLNIPFTHSEERPSRVLLAKASLAGAHTLLLYLMARTPGAPSVKEVKPTAAISWKSIGVGPVRQGGAPIRRCDSTGPLGLDEAFAGDGGYTRLETTLDGVFLDAGENGLFSPAEFETLTALGLMEFLTPEEISDTVMREIEAKPTGKDVVAALDAATLGPTYRAGVLRGQALAHMDAMEKAHGVQAVAYEMLGPPRLSKLLFEAALLGRLYGTLEAATGLDPDDASARTEAIVREDDDFRQRILTIGLPILLPGGDRILRGAAVKVPPEPGLPADHPRVVDNGWVDLRPSNWERWRDRIRTIHREIQDRPGLEMGSVADHEYGDDTGAIRPGRLAAWIFRVEDKGERIKR